MTHISVWNNQQFLFISVRKQLPHHQSHQLIQSIPCKFRNILRTFSASDRKKKKLRSFSVSSKTRCWYKKEQSWCARLKIMFIHMHSTIWQFSRVSSHALKWGNKPHSKKVYKLHARLWESRFWPDASNRPFARPGHMIQNYICWWASCAVGLTKQRQVHCFVSPTVQLAHQYM